MPGPDRFSGVLCPVITPFRDNLSAAPEALIEHCRWLESRQVGLAVFGTNSEANSLSVDEKIELLDRLIDAGIEPHRLMPGTGCCALSDTVALTRHAVAHRCGGVLVLPPFYYKNVSDDGLYRSFAEVIERVGDARLRIYLYHIPPVAGVGIGIDLIDRLLRDFPRTIAGIKDSSGDWSNTAAMHDRQWPDFRIFVGSETLLLANMRAGGAGCISATANVNPAAIEALSRLWQDDDGDARQRSLDEYRRIVEAYPMIPALKAITAHRTGERLWSNVRPPLVPLEEPQRQRLIDTLGRRENREIRPSSRVPHTP